MRIVISGASSFVGINLIRVLLKDNSNEIIGLVRRNSPNEPLLDEFNGRIKIIHLDLDEIDCLNNYIDYLDVFYLVAWRGTRGQDRNNEELQKKNYIDTMKTINITIKLGAKTIIGVGSQAEYGLVYDAIDEETKLEPITAYGKYKLKVFNDGLDLCSRNSVNFKWGRIFSAYGVGDYSESLIMYSVKQMLNDKNVLVTECSQKWNYINIKDVAIIFSKMIDKEIPSGVYNISSNDTRVLKDFLLEIKRIIGYTKEISCGTKITNVQQPSLIPVNAKIMHYLPNYDFVLFRNGILEIVRSMNKQ